MNQRRHLTAIAAAATLMASFPLEVLFQGWTWIFQAIAVTVLIVCALLGARALRTPVWAQPLIGLLALLIGTTWLHAAGHALGGIIPDADTFRYFSALVGDAGTNIHELTIPVVDTPGLLFLTTAGIGACVVLVDLLAVGLRKPALAGLPMLAIYTVPVEIDTKSLSFIPFAIGACGFMWLLVSDSVDRVRLFGRRFTGDGRGVDTWETSPLSSIGRRLATIGVVAAIAIPAALPGVGGGIIHEFGSGNGDGGSGNCPGICHPNGSVNLFAQLSGHLNNSQVANMIAVQTNNTSPKYLRFAVAEDLKQSGFSPESPSGGPLNQSQTTPQSIPGLAYQQYKATVTVEGLDTPFLPIYPETMTRSITSVSKSWYYDLLTEEVFSTNSTTKSIKKYQFTYDEPSFDLSYLRTVTKTVPQTSPVFKDTRLPQTVPQVTNFVKQHIGNATNEYDVVRNLYDGFGTKYGFSYQLSTAQGTAGSDIGNFLQQKKGYCTQYASALAWVVRAAGYPARVAFGFTQGSPVTPQIGAKTYQLTSADLHAWTEVYFEGYGWVPFDATPTTGINGSVVTAWAPGTDAPQTTVAGQTRPTIGASASVAAPINAHPTQSGIATVGSGTTGVHQTPIWQWLIAAVILLIIVLFASPFLVRLAIRRRRSATDRKFAGGGIDPGEPWIVLDNAEEIAAAKHRAHTAWDEFIDTLIDFDVEVDPAETPLATAARVIATTDLSAEAGAGVRTLGSSEQQARYARWPTAVDALDDDLRLFRRELAENVTFGVKMRAMLLPPSVTNRWRAQANNTAARAAAAMQSMREAVARNLRWLSAPRRLLAGRGAR